MPRNASKEQIRNTYRNLAKQFHPDRNPGKKEIEEKFKEITEAYNVLSDEYARHKYDLKRAYRENKGSRKEEKENRKTSRGKENGKENGRRKYHGNYGEARAKNPDELKKEKRFTWFVYATLLFFASLVTIMLITGPSETEEEKAARDMVTQSIRDRLRDMKIKQQQEKKIYSADSPYDPYFGDGIYLEETNNSVIVVNSNEYDVVACLVEQGGGRRTIRNEYLGQGESYRMNGIPNGTYYIKAYFGTDWDPDKVLIKDKIKGGFRNEAGFFKSDDKKNLLVIQQKQSGDNLMYSAYEVYLVNLVSDTAKRITAEEFFH